MLSKNLASFLLLYARPVQAIGRILDHGRIWIGLIVALIVSLLLHASDGPPIRDPGIVWSVLLRVLSVQPGSWIFPIGVLVVVLAPSILLARAASGFGSFGILMQSDYTGLLNCVLLSWSAALLPLTLAGFGGIAWAHSLPAGIAANLYFAALLTLSVRTIFGMGTTAAIGITMLGCMAIMLGGLVLLTAGPLLRYLMSPLLLYYAYLMLGSDFRSLGQGLRSRQHFREQLEMATNNPRDADAHYQLGLLYQKRRQYTEAIARFRRAVEIDPSEADAHLQLGRIAREQGRFEDAIQHLKTSAGIDDKLSLNEVWRELGAAFYGASQFEPAAEALARYTDRRAYDPEGLYWYGKTLEKLGRRLEAKEMFERSIDAVQTMPSHRRAEVRKWSRLSRGEMKNLK